MQQLKQAYFADRVHEDWTFHKQLPHSAKDCVLDLGIKQFEKWVCRTAAL